VFNVVVSNVPGPKEPRYLYGARLANLYPVSIPMHGGALNVTCFSHAGVLNFGLTACRDSLPHMQQLTVSLGRAVDRLEELYCGKVTPLRPAAALRSVTIPRQSRGLSVGSPCTSHKNENWPNCCMPGTPSPSSASTVLPSWGSALPARCLCAWRPTHWSLHDGLQ